MKYALALSLILFSGCTHDYSKTKFYCISPSGFQLVDPTSPDVSVVGSRSLGFVRIKDPSGTYYVNRALCIEAVEE